MIEEPVTQLCIRNSIINSNNKVDCYSTYLPHKVVPESNVFYNNTDNRHTHACLQACSDVRRHTLVAAVMGAEEGLHYSL